MKTTELMAILQAALAEHGDIEVCAPEFDEPLTAGATFPASAVVRLAGDSCTPEESWPEHWRRTVVVVG